MPHAKIKPGSICNELQVDIYIQTAVIRYEVLGLFNRRGNCLKAKIGKKESLL